MDVGAICTGTIVVATRALVLREAARLMREHHGGSIAVEGEEGDEGRGRRHANGSQRRGRRGGVGAKDGEVLPVSIGEVMSENLLSVREHGSAFDALRLLPSRGVLRVPLTDGGTGAVDRECVRRVPGLQAILPSLGPDRIHGWPLMAGESTSQEHSFSDGRHDGRRPSGQTQSQVLCGFSALGNDRVGVRGRGSPPGPFPASSRRAAHTPRWGRGAARAKRLKQCSAAS
jgi:CBS domain-containing protein